MKSKTRLKATLIAIMAMVLFLSQTAGADYNYGEALQKAIYFYMQQRCGPLPADNPVIWRADSCLNDGADVGQDLAGGYLDAGDNVKFGLPMASTVATLSWGVYEYRSAFVNAGLLDKVLDDIRWGTDYFIKCHTATNEFYYQVGAGSADHAWWGPVEVIEEVMTRPSYKVTAASPGSCVVGGTAAALASASIVLMPTDPNYASLCLTHAQQLFDFAYTTQSDSGYTAANGFYTSYSGYWDELSAAAAWLYLATNDANYLAKAELCANNWGMEGQTGYWGYKWTHSWDDMHYMAQILLARATGKQIYIDSIERNLDFWQPGGGITYTPGGLAWLDSWASLRYAANASLLAFIWADDSHGNAAKKTGYRNFAVRQIKYILGDNPRAGSYIIGFGANYPQYPHHRTAHGSWANSIDTPSQTRHVIQGAMVGGPDSSDNYQDVRSNYTENEVACDYDAALVGALAKMYSLYGGTPISGFPRTSDFAQDQDPYTEYFPNAKINSQGTTYTEWSVDLTNHSAWPARVTDKLSYRYFFDLTEAFNAGYTINNVTVTKNYTEVPVTVTGPTHLRDNIYYVTVDYTGSAIYPGGQSESARETQVRIALPNNAPAAAWDPNNDWSYQGLTTTAAQTPYIPVYDNGIRIYGQEPGPILPPVSIAGFIKNDCDVPISGVLVTATNSGGQYTTDINGFYTFSVDSNWSGTITPSKKHYTFEPNQMIYANVEANAQDQNYTANNIYDLDCDGVIGLGDFAVMADYWLATGPGIPCDFVADGTVNFLDFAKLASASTNNPPTISIISPADGTEFNAPATVTINATASDSDGSVSKVDFYQGSTLLGTDTNTPYSFTWNNVTDGNYILTAKATDDEGAVTTSSAVNITVNVTTGCTCIAGCDTRTVITAPFTQDGAGEFCWESTNLGTYINNWNMDKLTVNGTDYTGQYVFTSAIPKINGKYYVYYKGSYAWSHFEAEN
ncbi:MAG: glycoside hydrolase family 9 protein [Sedimentisphaerales bacterium]